MANLTKAGDDLKAQIASLTQEKDNLKKEIEGIMPQLAAKYQSVKDKDLFEIYKGRKGYRAMILDILREKPTFWKGFGNFR